MSLPEDFVADVRALVPDGDTQAAPAVATDLVRRWGEPHRSYHDGRHLEEVLAALAELEVAGEVGDRPMVCRLAAWFHDAVYETARNDNESVSAELARIALSDLGVTAIVVEEVADLVLDSGTHQVDEDSGPRAAFQDADLWILAAPSDRFEEYCLQVRAEYAAVPDELYGPGRRAVLTPLADRPRIYRTGHARRHWEPRARTNLARELDRLSRVR